MGKTCCSCDNEKAESVYDIYEGPNSALQTPKTQNPIQ